MTPVELRRELHRRPELSFEERRTAETIGRALTEAGIAWHPIAGTGILARIEGRGDRTRAVVLRADIDALPVEERTGLPWSSENPGVMHACGHDLHAAVLYGVLCALREGDFEGTLFGLFQPGEECNPGGASLVLAENPFRGYRVQAVVGEHVEPDLPVGTFGFRPGKYMAANDELRFTLCGRGGHAALRRQTQDTVRAAARLILRLTRLNGAERIVSVGRVEAEGATNVIPDRVRLEGTMRCFDERVRRTLKERIGRLCDELARSEEMEIVPDIRAGYPCVVNDRRLTLQAAALAERLGYGTEALALRPTSEDFGWYATRYPALFYRLGVGPGAGRTHTASFSPREGAIHIGIDFMKRLALNFLKQ